MPFTETDFSFGAPITAGVAATVNYDLQISKNYPALELSGTEANSQYVETREIAGDLYIVTNATYNGVNWVPILNAQPAHGIRFLAAGITQNIWCAAGVTPIVWAVIFTLDALGALQATPLPFLSNAEKALSLAPTWNAGTQVMTGILENVTDTASNAVSKLLDLQVGGVSKFSVDKAGNITSPTLGGTGGNPGTGLLGSTLIKYGTALAVPADAASSPTVTFATAFPTACVSVLLTPEVAYTNQTLSAIVSSKVPASFVINVNGGAPASTVTVDWLAFGY